MPDEDALPETVGLLARVFARRNVQHALIGGLAVGLRSRPRATKDAGFLLHVPSLSFPPLLEELADEGFDIPLIETIRRWSSEHMIAFRRGRVQVDWLQPVIPLYA